MLNPPRPSRRSLLVLSAGAVAQACSGSLPLSDGRDATADARGDAGELPDRGASVDAVVTGDAGPAADGSSGADAPLSQDVDDPFAGLDGGVPRPALRGWAPPGGTEVGLIADHPVGLWRYHPGARAVVARDAQGFYAYSAICTHEGCLLLPPGGDGRAECPCHRSVFDGAGRALPGSMATTALRRYAVTLSAGRIFVDPAARAADGDRAVPPDPDAGVGGADVQRIDGAVFDSSARDAGAPDVDLCMEGRDVGPVSMFGLGTWTLVTAARVIVARDGRGLFAFSALCTHSGCTVDPPNPTSGTSRCSCHGSEFDGNGVVTRAPAREDLDHFVVAVCAGRVRVDSGRVVNPGTRTPVP